ncbi:transcriptional regulator [Sinomonas cellulolyticus]|uniref:DUF4188 domain-containing protein n=1 Tax=Sinomonas cellulolyticus TaxID=2801916 RepID=A0ABS1K519_9MICC|nr:MULTISPECIES: DUF4188 domain-containing protein [Sinomonas]MBL0705972.1 DUF4188 domain-containing protein [Sinomonas cellulolyticus]GHG42874.1 transcriptional regulator [Sinomonas sp. KCTC 49339]
MAQDVFPGRYTATPGESATVFLIGMRANRWWKIPTVVRVGSAMGRMLAYLSRTPEAGMLGYHQWAGRTTILVSYWKSPEHLQRFAADRDAPHLAPWRDFMRTLAGSGEVGVWHETYQVPASGIEAVYSGMPRFGLARAVGHVPVTAGLTTARQRLRASRAA